MLHLLASNTFLLIFLVITMGAILGAIPIAGIRFGSAGTLFVGLAVGAVVQHPTGDLKALQSLGLGLFVYLVGLESGEEFFRELKQQFGVIAGSITALAVGAVTAVVAGLLLHTPASSPSGSSPARSPAHPAWPWPRARRDRACRPSATRSATRPV